MTDQQTITAKLCNRNTCLGKMQHSDRLPLSVFKSMQQTMMQHTCNFRFLIILNFPTNTQRQLQMKQVSAISTIRSCGSL